MTSPSSRSATGAAPMSMRFGVLDAATLVAVLALGGLNLLQPFSWDQAVFVLGGKALASGATYYVDFWDLKQPGGFWFYALGGSLFGFSEAGIHLFELLYWLAFSVVVLVTQRASGAAPWVARAAVLFSVGLYYAYAYDTHMTQLEVLVAFPMYVSAWAASEALRGGRARHGLLWVAGIAGGATLVLKLPFLPLIGIMWLAALVPFARAEGRLRISRAIVPGAVLGAGMALPVIATIAAIVAQGAGAEALHATFVAPASITKQAQFRPHQLFDGLTWFFSRWAPVAAIAVLGTIAAFRSSRDAHTIQLALWCVFGFLLIVVQRQSLWQYQYFLVSMPLGILAARGAGALAPLARRSADGIPHAPGRVALALATIVFFAWPLGAAGHKLLHLAHERFGLTEQHRRNFQDRRSSGDAYETIRGDVAFLADADARPGPIFVVGNPIIHLLSDRGMAIPRPGGSLTLYATREDWDGMTRGLERVRPPYIFVARDKSEVLDLHWGRTAAFRAFLERDYEPLRESAAGTGGTWFVLRDPR